MEALDVIAGELKEAVGDVTCWSRVLDRINVFVNGSGAVLLSVDERLRHAPTSSDMAEMMDSYFREGWYSRDNREGCRPLLLKKGVAFDYEFQDCDELEKSCYYSDFLAKHGRKWFVGLGGLCDGDLWCLALQRAPSKGAFQSGDLPRIRAVQSRLAEATNLAHGYTRGWLDGALNAFDHAGSATAFLDREGRVVEMNATARSIVGSYVNRSGYLRLPGLTINKWLDDVRQSRRVTVSNVLGRLSIDVGRQAYTVEAVKIWDTPSLTMSKISILLRIYRQEFDPVDVLRAKYALTFSEIRVALLLASGCGVSGIADALRIMPNTVRAHLKSAYAKTGIGNQAKLVAFIASLTND